jgi:hypothetical protein
MPDRDLEYRAALASYAAALARFDAASSVVNLHLLTGTPPTTAERLAEETARIRLIMARRHMISLPWAVPPRRVAASLEGQSDAMIAGHQASQSGAGVLFIPVIV